MSSAESPQPPSCPACGQSMQAQSRFCPRCGAEARLGPGQRARQGARAAGDSADQPDYRILQSLSKGGMGAIYLATDRRAFDRPCVVKQMLDYYDPADPHERQLAAAAL